MDVTELFDFVESDPEKGVIEAQNFINNIEKDKKPDLETLSDGYLALSIANKKLESWMKGIESAEKSINISKKIKDKFLRDIKICKAYKEIGEIYQIVQDFPKAIKEFDEAIKIIEKFLGVLTKNQEKILEENYYKNSSIAKTMYFDFLKQKVSIYLKLNDEKNAKVTIVKPWTNFLKTKNNNNIENLAYLAELNIFLIKRLKYPMEMLKWVGELLILDVFAKKISHNKDYWTERIHSNIKENSQALVEMLNLSMDDEILGRETLKIIKQVKFENQDLMYMDKLLKLKKNKKKKNKIDNLNDLFEQINKDNTSPIIQLMTINEIMLVLIQNNEYKEAIQKSKDALNLLKAIKDKDTKIFMAGKIALILFQLNLKKQNYKQAEKEAKNSINYFEENLNIIGHAQFTKLELASSYIIQNLLDKAELILDKSLEVAEEIRSIEFLARLFELSGGLKLKLNDNHNAAINFQISALFYLISNEEDKYQEFVTLAINLYNEYLKEIGFSGLEFI